MGRLKKAACFFCGIAAGIIGGVVEESAGDEAGKVAGIKTRDFLLENVVRLPNPKKKLAAQRRAAKT